MTGTIGGDHSESLQASLRTYWDADAAAYDLAASHMPRSAAVNAAWAAALLCLLPPPPARILDVGAGTGFLSLGLAQLGYRVTALDSALAMLERLAARPAKRDWPSRRHTPTRRARRTGRSTRWCSAT